MDFDWLTIHVDKINTLSEWTSLIFLLSIAATVVWYVLSKKKADAIQKIDSNTITSYKNALESTRTDLQTQLDHCSSQHKESQDQINELNKVISDLQGQIKTLREIPLADMAKSIDKVVVVNGKMLDELKKVTKGQ